MAFPLTHRSKIIARAKKLEARRHVVAPKDSQSLRKQKAQASSGLIAVLVKPLPNMERLQSRLERTGSHLSARNFLLRSLLFTGVCAGTATATHLPPLLGASVGVILGFWLPVKALGFKIESKKKKFLQLFPDAIDLIVRGLRSGLPVSESIVLVGNEVSDPVGSSFRNIASTMQLGVTMEEALQNEARKLDSTEFNFFITSIILQRETGGNLSEILGNLGEVIRKRYMMKMKIKAMTSEARASSVIIGSLPFVVGLALFVLSPEYVGSLWQDPRGNKALALAAGMLYTGIWSMNRMAKFEI